MTRLMQPPLAMRGMEQKKIVEFVFLGLLVFVLAQVLEVFKPFLEFLFWAGLLAFVFYPAHRSFQRLLHVPHGLAALLTSLVILALCVPFVTLVIRATVDQAADIYNAAARFIQEGRWVALIERLRAFQLVQAFEQKVLVSQTLKDQFTTAVLEGSQALRDAVVGQAAALAKSVVTTAAGMVLVILVTFFFLRDGERAYRFFYESLPMAERDKELIFPTINQTLTAVVRGQLLTAFLQGLAATAVFTFLGLPIPFFLGFVTFFGSLIPLLGASVVWGPIALYLYAAGETHQAMILASAGFFGISLIDNLLKPLLIGGRTKLPPLLLFLAMLGALRAYGLVGLFLGPVLLALLFVMITIFKEKYGRGDVA